MWIQGPAFPEDVQPVGDGSGDEQEISPGMTDKDMSGQRYGKDDPDLLCSIPEFLIRMSERTWMSVTR